MISSQINIQHLFWRAGFGPSPDKTSVVSLSDNITNLFKASQKITLLEIKNWNPVLASELKNMNTDDRADYRKQERQARLQINQDILDRYAFGEELLRNKMTFFWMGHFACRIANPVFIADYYNTINTNSLGNFGDLLKSMIRNGALLQYLNNNQNRKSSPNENFARELMELFTLGIGNYSEKDVREGARALTGWGFDRSGKFMIRKEHHDTGSKEFLGEKGLFDGDDLVRIILEKKQCARFITLKIYKFFVNEIPDETIINDLAEKFYNSSYDLQVLMKNIFTSEWFYAEKNIGSQIKSPIVLLTGIIKNFHVSFQNPMMAVQIQKVLGQLFFDPPNVAGWPGGRAWIDSSTLMYRMRLPEVLLQDAESIIAPKEDFDAQETLKPGSQTQKKAKTIFDHTQFTKSFIKYPEAKRLDEMMNYMLQIKPADDKIILINKLATERKSEAGILKSAIYLMSLPEYQLC